MTLDFNRPKLVVIHGWGGSFLEAISRIETLFDFSPRWEDGSFFVDKRSGSLLRQILFLPHPDQYVRAFQELILARFLLSCVEETARQKDSARQETRFDEEHLLEKFPKIGLLLSPSDRVRRGQALLEEARNALRPILPLMSRLTAQLRTPEGTEQAETEARETIRRELSAMPDAESLLRLLEHLRDMHETGGDLDTLASATLYAHWLTAEAVKQGRALEYGRHYQFVFLNYHESLRPLARYAPADLFIADLPVGAFPGLDSDARFLADRGIRLQRYEDHHPYTDQHYSMLSSLRDDDVLGFFEASGPKEGRELPQSEWRCGADMVHQNTIADTVWDCNGARRLREAAHAEDFVSNRTRLSRVLTTLIKGGFCKTELAQIMFASIRDDDLWLRLQDRGLYALAASWEKHFTEIGDALQESVYILELERRQGGRSDKGGEALGPGSDMPRHLSSSAIRIIISHAVPAEPGMPRPTVGQAADYFSRVEPTADYLFYCYGASVIVARRLNQADLSLNLGQIMPLIGTEGDGGHGGAAVCRPEQNPYYPQRLLGYVTRSNFEQFVRYLGDRLQAGGYRRVRVINRSAPHKGELHRGGLRLAAVALAAALIGALLLLHPSFRPRAVRESNRDFFPQISDGAVELQARDEPREGPPK